MSEEHQTSGTPTKGEEAPKITSVKTEKVKDPKRVAQGKKLALISKEAKERKARERMQAEIDQAS